MQPPKYTIAILESSPVILKGICTILKEYLYVSRVVEFNPEHSWEEQVAIHNPDAIIINPLLINNSHNIKNMFNNKKTILLIALNSHLLQEKLLRYFDTSFSIYDLPEVIEEKLRLLINSDPATNVYTSELSQREKEILIALTKGLSNKEIADFFNISIHTVITHRRNITRKLDIHSVSGLTVYAIVNKLIDIQELK